MAAVLGWGLWNQRLTEWFNPGGKQPYVTSKEAAGRMHASARRQYPMGTWELREYYAEEDGQGGDAIESDDTGDAIGRPGATHSGTGTRVAPRRGA